MAAPPPGPRPKRKDYPWQSAFDSALALWQSNKQAWEQENPSSSRAGSTMYDRRARTGHTPRGARGSAKLRGDDAGQGHGTQDYDDGHRLSRDTDGFSDDNVHWTNQRLGKKHDDRHTPPEDAR